MAKIPNVYKDKETKKWFYKKRLPKGNILGKNWAIKKGFATASEAKQALQNFLNGLSEMEVNADKEISKESEVSFELFIENVAMPHFKRDLKKGTYQQKIGHCRHIKGYFKGKTFREIEQKDIANFRSYLMDLKNSHGEPLSSMYLNLVLSTLGQIYDLACEHDVVKENIARNIKGLRQITKKEVQYWTYEEFQRFLSVIEGNSYLGYFKKLGFYFLFFTGLRVGEMMARKWTDIDWENQSIYVDSTLYYRNKENWSASTKDGTKTASSTGWVKLTPKIIEMLKEWREKQRDIFGDIPYIFMYDGTMYTPIRWNCWKTTLVKKWNQTAKANEVLENIRVHDLRDSHGMWLLSQGVDIKTIQKRLRHAKATTTMNYYLDRLPENEEKVLQEF